MKRGGGAFADGGDEALSALLMARASSIRHWIFDLDDTLYDPGTQIFTEVKSRISRYVERRLGLSAEAARVLRDRYYREYGATLSGLLLEHGVVAEEYLSMVHGVGLDRLHRSEALARSLSALPGRRYIHTNSSRHHTERVLGHLGLLELFDDIVDVVATGWRPKPQPEGYALLLLRNGIDPGCAIFFEDSVVNLAPARAVGMATVLVRYGGVREGAEDFGCVDHVTYDLAGCLRALCSRMD
ncbi:MAG: pyrimidine 5'-nucleotidase [Alphaproteobacteria bacterium]